MASRSPFELEKAPTGIASSMLSSKKRSKETVCSSAARLTEALRQQMRREPLPPRSIAHRCEHGYNASLRSPIFGSASSEMLGTAGKACEADRRAQLATAPDADPRRKSPQVRYTFQCGSAPVSGRSVGRRKITPGVEVVFFTNMSDFTVEIELEDDGRWIGEVVDLPGVLAYGSSREEAVARAKALAFRVLADRIEHGEDIPELRGVFAVHG